MSAPVSLTFAQQKVIDELQRLLAPDSEWRTGVLLLSYASPDGDGCRIAHATGMRAVDLDCAFDLVQMVKMLKLVTAELESVVARGVGSGGR